jgi:hypothetical protein
MNKTLVFNVLKFFILIFFIFISLELLLRLYSKINNISFTSDNRYSNIYRVYHEGETYNPRENFYVYKKDIRQKRFLNFYFDKKEKKLVKIWDYNFSTNNFGLVQSSNLNLKKKSILLLGDSFTQGTGSEPWIDDIVKEIDEYQVINGDIGAAGFIQFSNLNKYLSSQLNIKKRIVIFISQDIRRNVVIFKNTKCLLNHLDCTYKNNPLSIPNDDRFNIENYLYEKIIKKYKSNTKKKFRFFVRELYVYQYFRSSINSVRLRNDRVIKKNLETIKDLDDKYKDEIIFIRINDASDIMFKRDSYETKIIKNFFKNNKISKFFCDMNNDLTMFHKYDLHPNKKGYKLIQNCILKILEKNL